MRIATGIIETWPHEDYNIGPSTEHCIKSFAEDFAMTPAEVATFTANGAVALLDVGVTVQLDYEPESYDAAEWYSVQDGVVTRGWSSPGIFADGGKVQL